MCVINEIINYKSSKIKVNKFLSAMISNAQIIRSSRKRRQVTLCDNFPRGQYRTQNRVLNQSLFQGCHVTLEKPEANCFAAVSNTNMSFVISVYLSLTNSKINCNNNSVFFLYFPFCYNRS